MSENQAEKVCKRRRMFEKSIREGTATQPGKEMETLWG